MHPGGMTMWGEMKETFSLHFCLGSGGHTHRHPQLSSTPKMLVGRAAEGPVLEPSCQFPASAKPGQDHPEGHFWSALWFLPPQGRLQVSQTPKVPLGEPIWRLENKVEIAQAASQRQKGRDTPMQAQERALERNQLIPWWGGAG